MSLSQTSWLEMQPAMVARWLPPKSLMSYCHEVIRGSHFTLPLPLAMAALLTV